MARSKQAEPLRRNPSSEYTSKADGTGARTLSSKKSNKELNGNAPTVNGALKSDALLKGKTQKEAGALQLIFAVAGIYGSLWVLAPEDIANGLEWGTQVC